jgi:hypothetical protein
LGYFEKVTQASRLLTEYFPFPELTRDIAGGVGAVQGDGAHPTPSNL